MKSGMQRPEWPAGKFDLQVLSAIADKVDIHLVRDNFINDPVLDRDNLQEMGCGQLREGVSGVRELFEIQNGVFDPRV